MPRPNALLICVDHWQGRLLGALGHPDILSPTLDQFTANGVAYTNAYSTTPICIPARRELMTGARSPTHGDRVFNEKLPMPDLPTLAQTFRDAGYQASSVGKLHVYPQRDRIGFDDALIDEEGRHHLGLGLDDYEMFLTEQGFPGQEYTHGMGNNSYVTRPWHLPEFCHPTNWTAREMCKSIVRRDPTRPAFWYMSFRHPHPPLTPLDGYLEIYRDHKIDMPFIGEWARDPDNLPHLLRVRDKGRAIDSETKIRMARQAFYALCTHIDHQIRTVIGTLREEGLVDNTVIMLTADHGDMLGNHGLWAKGLFYEEAAKIPMILAPTADQVGDIGHGVLDNRLAIQADVMPTLLELCGIPVPETVEGLSLVGRERREYVYGDMFEGPQASRMIRDARYKLIYYPVGNRTQLFDLDGDPNELHDLANNPESSEARDQLTGLLVENLYGSDLEWLKDGQLVGIPEPKESVQLGPNRGINNQRGWRFR